MKQTELQKNKFSFSVWKKIALLLSNCGRLLCAVSAVSLLIVVADVLYPLFQAYLINNFVEQGTTAGIWIFAAAYLATLLFQAVLIYAVLKLCIRLELRATETLRNRMFRKFQTLPVGYFNDRPVGQLVSRTLSDTERVSAMAAWTLMDLIWSVLYLIGIYVPMFILSPKLSAILLAMLPVFVCVSVLSQRKVLKQSRILRRANASVTAALNEGITGAVTVKTLAAEDKFSAEFGGLTQDMVHHTRKYALIHAAFVNMLTFLVTFGVGAVLVWGGAQLESNGITGGMSIGTLSAFLAYVLNMAWPVKQIGEHITALMANQANAERILAVMEETPAVADSPEVTARYGDFFNPKTDNWEPMRGDIEFENVSFRYPGSDKYILRHFNLVIPAGSSLALVGETGAGKTTIVNLICRFMEPEEGRVLIDGRDIRERSQLWLSHHLGYVMQSPQLFSGTVADNIRFGKPDAGMAEVEAAARAVSCHDFITALEKGYDTELGGGGDALSSGQKQLITFARALVKDPRILILDEATSSIDTETEHTLQQAIGEILKGRTSVAVAHRLSTVRGADAILVIEDGAVLERGTHKELLAQKGAYHRFYTKLYELESVDKAGDTV